VRVAQRRCALYGLLIYPQGDRAGVFFSYDFYRNKVVLLPEVKEPRYVDIRELKVPVVVYVEVVYPTDAAASGVEDLGPPSGGVRGAGDAGAGGALAGSGSWGSPPFPSAVRRGPSPRYYSVVVRSHRSVRTAGSPHSQERRAKPIARVPIVSITAFPAQ
jgi:hypothetical protein